MILNESQELLEAYSLCRSHTHAENKPDSFNGTTQNKRRHDHSMKHSELLEATRIWETPIVQDNRTGEALK